MTLPEEFVILKFYALGYYPKYNKFTNTYQCSCPICREGKSLGKKRRCYYIPENDNIFCHNCGWSSKPLKWICEVSGESEASIIGELKKFVPDVSAIVDRNFEAKPSLSSLPKDSINLNDSAQLSYYKNNDNVRAVELLMRTRRLDTACNRPDRLYISLVDIVHKNRLIIPFINEHNKIEFYQSRTVLSRDAKTKPKYLGKVGSEKTLFNIDRIDSSCNHVYIFEGPLNAFFTRNSLAVAGITERGRSFTTRQQEQLNTVLKFYEKIWVLDSQWIDNASLIKTEALLAEGEKVFIWPEKFGKRFKDFNDIAIKCKIDEIKHEFIQKNTFSGLEGIVRLAEIKRFRSDTLQ